MSTAKHKRKPRHTPGPWKWVDKYQSRIGDKTWSLVHDGNFICGVLSCDGETNSPQLCNESDAHLIAAAPDLLEALEMVRDADDDCIKDGIPRWCTDSARRAIDQAIAKATGGGA
jgi:hypothetical protein